MGATINVEVAALTNKAASFDSKRMQLMNIINSMNSSAESLWAAWTGAAADEFKIKLNRFLGEAQYLDRLIAEHVRDLNAIAEEYVKTGNASDTLASGLTGAVGEKATEHSKEALPNDIIK